ncbi:MAG: hypothetical protein LBH17_01545, partial [Oscillospiraceae bacterium]|nr:hypothetical protein [Oscillospiraceae bacterium]
VLLLLFISYFGRLCRDALFCIIYRNIHLAALAFFATGEIFTAYGGNLPNHFLLLQYITGRQGVSTPPQRFFHNFFHKF